ncbi:MAG: MaoC family dehydratase N-terminal domain-containing protein [Pseudomonadales bacterium]|nr:MaoC family dehydratase N-terminal domain-containing protein [Pseudomonadales bacterium]
MTEKTTAAGAATAPEEESMITEDMLERKGVWGTSRTSPAISESDIRKWAIATYWPEKPPSIYWDAEYASTTRHKGIIAPPDFNPFAWPVERPAKKPRPKKAKPAKRRTGLNGGQTETYGVAMRPGDVITTRSRLKEWDERQGKMGLMLYTYNETEWTNQDNERVKSRISIGIKY